MPPNLIARMESVPFSQWHTKCRIVMGSATFFDAFNALSLAFALPVLIRRWHISSAEIGRLISVSYVGQLAGARAYSAFSVMLLATLSYGIIGSANAVIYLYTPEIYPTRMRAIGTGPGTSWLRIASAVGPAAVGVMVGPLVSARSSGCSPASASLVHLPRRA
jgi:hypothetical protein